MRANFIAGVRKNRIYKVVPAGLCERARTCVAGSLVMLLSSPGTATDVSEPSGGCGDGDTGSGKDGPYVAADWRNRSRCFDDDVTDAASGQVICKVFYKQEAVQAGSAGAAKPAGPGRKRNSEGIAYITSLDRAIAWRESLQNGIGKPCIVVAHEKPRADFAATGMTSRVYETMPTELFLTRYARRRYLNMLGSEAADAMQSPVANDRFACEVTAGPCKLFFDLEFVRALNAGRDGDAMQAHLLERCALALQRHCGAEPVAVTDLVVLDSSNAEKFSRHVIATLDGGRTVFADSHDIGRFVRSVIDGDDSMFIIDKGGSRVPFPDPSVYNGRQPFRLYGAAKYADPGRLMVDIAGCRTAHTPWTAWDPDMTLLRRSMVTYHGPALLDPQQTRFLTIVEAVATTAAPPQQQQPPQQQLLGSLPMSASKRAKPWAIARTADRCGLSRAVTEALFAVPGIAEHGPRSCTFKPETHVVFIACESKACPLAGREHASNTVYVHVDLARGKFRLRCHSQRCKGAKLQQFQPLPCKQIIDEFLSGSATTTAAGAPAAAPRALGRQASLLLLE